MKHAPIKKGRKLLQAAVPKGLPPQEARRANGRNMRGVIIQIYPRDEPPAGTVAPAATYAAVLVYGARRALLPRVQIAQPFGSLHTGVLGGLRASTLSIGGVLDLEHVDPTSLDGTHVVVSFLDDDLALPYLSAILEHPRADLSTATDAPETERTRLLSTDEHPLLIRWNGCVWGVTSEGDFILDTTNAHRGELNQDGTEPAAPADGSTGNAVFRIPAESVLSLQIGGGDTLVLESADGGAKLTLGDGAVSVAVAEHLNTWAESLRTWLYTRLIVQTAFGPSAPPATAGAPPPPEWDPKIQSDKMKLPDTD